MDQRVSLTCFSPFLLRGSLSCSININEAMAIFASLIPDLQRLEKSLEEHSISLRWCKEAMVVLKKMHSEFLLFFEKFKVPISWDGVDGLWDEYMKETLNILDLCNLLKSAISGFSRYRLMVDFAVKNLYDCKCIASTSNAEIRKLKEESKKLYGVEKWKKKNLYKAGTSKTRCKDSTIHAIYVVKSGMNIVSMLIFSAILCPIPIKIDKDMEFYRGFPHDQLKPFLESIEKLVDCFTRGGDGSRMALVESQMIEGAIMDIQAQVTKKRIAADRDKFVKSLELLEQRSMALKEGLEMFDSAVTEVFEDIVKGRNKVLGMITTNTALN